MLSSQTTCVRFLNSGLPQLPCAAEQAASILHVRGAQVIRKSGAILQFTQDTCTLLQT